MSSKAQSGLKYVLQSQEGTRIDPVCKMALMPWDVRFEVEHAGESHAFCSSECRQTFLLFPNRFSWSVLDVA